MTRVPRSGKHPFAFPDGLRWLVFVPPVVGFVVTLLAGWPGGISPDMAATISEGTNFYFFGQQAPLFGLIWAIPLAVLPLPAVVAAFYILQSAGYWLTFLFFAVGSLRRRSPIAAAAAALAGFLPPLLDFAVMVESNVQAGVAWGLAVAIAYAFPRRQSLLVCLPLIFYGLGARSGLIVAAPAVLFACFLLTAPDIAGARRRAVVSSVMTTAGFAVASFMLTTLVPGERSRERILAISQLFDIAGVYQKTGTHCVPASFVRSGTTAEAVMARYDPALASSMIWDNSADTFVLPEAQADFASLRDCWIQTVRSHPAEYVQVKARFASIFLMAGVAWAPGTTPDFSSNEELGLSVPHNSLSSSIHAYVERSRTTLAWKGWFWFAFVGLSCAIAVALRLSRAGAAAALYTGAVGTLVPHLAFGQGALGRYYFLPYMLCVASLLLLGIWTREPETATDSSRQAPSDTHWLVLGLVVFLSLAQALLLLRTGSNVAGGAAVILGVFSCNVAVSDMRQRRRILLLIGFAGLILINIGGHLFSVARPVPHLPIYLSVLAGYGSIALAGFGAILLGVKFTRALVGASCLVAVLLFSALLIGGHVGSRFEPIVGAKEPPARAEVDRAASPWLLQIHDPGSSATLDEAPDRPDLLRIRIVRAEVPTPWHIQLNEPGLTVRLADTYMLSFRARAESPRRISYGVSMAHPPWESLGYYREVAVDSRWHDFSETFSPIADDVDARVHFDLGASPASVEVERVVLRRLPSGEIVAPRAPSN